MARGGWLKWGLIFSVIFFLVLYFLIYRKVVDDPNLVLMLGKMNVSFLGDFLSNIKNVIISSLILGFLLGLITGRGSRNRQYR